MVFGLTAGILLFGFVLVPPAAEAKVFKWKDDQGKYHFTDNPAKIPAKYRGHLEEFKGEPAPPAPPKAEEDEEAPAGEQAGDGTAVTEGGAPAPAEPAKPALSKEEKALLTALHNGLYKLWMSHLQVFSAYDESEIDQKKIAKVAQASADQKKQMAKAIGKNETPYYKKLHYFLKKSGKKEARLRETSQNLARRVDSYKKSLKKIIPKERTFIKEMAEKLEIKDEYLPDLESELARIAERKKKLQEGREQYKKKKLEQMKSKYESR